jgi:hypothetical protein
MLVTKTWVRSPTIYNKALEGSCVSGQFDENHVRSLTVKRLPVLFALLVLLSISALAGQLTGYVSDEKCAVSSAKAAKASDWVDPKAFQSCAQKCAKAGSAVVFVTEDNKVLKLNAESTKKAMPYLGHRVALSGSLDNGTLKIDRIASIKMDAKAGTSSVEGKMHEKQ